MYRLVSEGVLPHTPSMYRHVSSHLAQARREGRLPDLIDTLRDVHVPPASPDAGAFLREAVGWFSLDRTEGQRPVYVAAEKGTLRRLLTGWLGRFFTQITGQGEAAPAGEAQPDGGASPSERGWGRCHRERLPSRLETPCNSPVPSVPLGEPRHRPRAWRIGPSPRFACCPKR
jgi:hypothetical protein